MAILRFKRYDICVFGSKPDGVDADVYLTRWVLRGERHTAGSKIFLHCFHRSDYDRALHDHPWRFTSFIIWPGYYEHFENGIKWISAFSRIKRAAEWKHAIEILPGRLTWTLVFTGDKERSWGFWCPKGFVHWRRFDSQASATGDGCGE